MNQLETKLLMVALCLTLSACGGGGGSNECIVCAIPANQAPTALPVVLSLTPGESISSTVTASDPEGDPLTFRIDSFPARGDLRLTDSTRGSFTYTAPGAFTSEESFGLRVQDNQGNSSFAQITARISGAADSGTCAITISSLNATPRQIVVHARDPSRIAVLTRDGGNYPAVHTSLDGGATWLYSDALRELDVVKLAFHPTRRGTLFAAVTGFDRAGVKRSDDHGATWRPVLGVDGTHDVNVVWHSQQLGTSLWAATANGLHRSEDDGLSWNGTEASREFVSVTVARFSPGVAYASTLSGLYRAGDDSSWDRDGEGANSKLTYALSGLYAASDYALSRTVIGSSRFGETTQLLGSGAGTPVALADFALHPGDSSLLYVIESERLVASTDVGETWFYVDSADSLGPLTTVAVSNEGSVYVGTLNDIGCLRL